MKYQTGQINRLGHREKNQDRVAIAENGGSVLLVLADGLGGHSGGELASQRTVESFISDFGKASIPIANPRQFLADAVLNAHRSVVDAGKRQDPPIVPRTTCVGCIIQDGSAHWVHIGDSRLYVFREGETVFRTSDHSVVEQLIRKGVISEEERTQHPRRNQITRCLGGDEDPHPSFGERLELEDKEVILMCSDGLWDPLGDEMIADYVRAENLNEAIKEMSYQAETQSYPRSDNISVAAFQFIAERNKQGDVVSKPKKLVEKADQPTSASELEEAIAHMKDSINEFKKEKLQ